MARPSLTEQEIADFREKLCEIAARRFAEEGFAGVSLRGLAQELGCSPTTPYRYFENKEEIFAVVRARAFEKLAEYAAPFLELRGEPLGQLEELGFAYLRFAREEPDAYRIAFELHQPDASRYPELRRSQENAWQAIRIVVQRAIEAGAIEGELDVVSHVFWAGMHGLASLDLAGQLQSAPGKKLEKAMVQTMLRGVFPAEKGVGDD